MSHLPWLSGRGRRARPAQTNPVREAQTGRTPEPADSEEHRWPKSCTDRQAVNGNKGRPRGKHGVQRHRSKAEAEIKTRFNHSGWARETQSGEKYKADRGQVQRRNGQVTAGDTDGHRGDTRR